MSNYFYTIQKYSLRRDRKAVGLARAITHKQQSKKTMKATIQSKPLAQALALTRRAIKRSTLPVLEYALIRTTQDTLELLATDLDVTCQISLPAKPDSQGAIAVPARKFNDVIKSCTDSVELETNDKNQLAVRNGSTFSLDGMDAVQFPTIPLLVEPQSATVNLSSFRQALTRVEYSQSTVPTRIVLNGVYFKLRPDSLELVATDGRRLALQTLHADATKPAEFILPSVTVKVLMAALPKKSGESILIQWTDRYVQFQFMNGTTTVQITSIFIDGNYPNYNQVIPQDFNATIHFNRAALLHAIKTADKGTTDKDNAVKLTFSPDLLTVSSQNNQAQSQVPCKYGPNQFAIAFNPLFWTDTLAALDCEYVTAKFVNELSPAVIQADQFTAVIMPMRLS